MMPSSLFQLSQLYFRVFRIFRVFKIYQKYLKQSLATEIWAKVSETKMISIIMITMSVMRKIWRLSYN